MKSGIAGIIEELQIIANDRTQKTHFRLWAFSLLIKLIINEKIKF